MKDDLRIVRVTPGAGGGGIVCCKSLGRVAIGDGGAEFRPDDPQDAAFRKGAVGIGEPCKTEPPNSSTKSGKKERAATDIYDRLLPARKERADSVSVGLAGLDVVKFPPPSA